MPETTPGGRALKFYASVRLDIRPAALEKKDDNPYIRKTRVKIVKSKVSTPFREAEVDIEFGKGISRSGEIIDIGVDLGLIVKSGAWFTYKDILKEQGRPNMKAALESNQEIMDELNDLIHVMTTQSFDEAVEEPDLGELPDEIEDNDSAGEDE